MVKDDVLYKRIGVPPTATKEEIRKQYKLLSKTAHPDKNRDNIEEANRIYQEINQAKDILLDDEKRRIYDQVGMDMLNSGAQGGECAAPDLNAFDAMFGGPFGSMFGGGGMFGVGGQRKEQENITETINVTLEQLFCEQTVDFTVKYKMFCQKCAGNGTKDGRSAPCTNCNGKGIKIQVMQVGSMIQQSQCECHICKGSGAVVPEQNKCQSCFGKTYIYKEKNVGIPLKRGLSVDNKLHLPGHGHQFKTGTTDLMLSINELPHKFFKRQGNNLCLTVDLKLYQALAGFTKVIEHLDGRKLYLSSTTRTDFNTVRKIPKEGMMGDLFIRFNIVFPEATSEYNLQLKTLLKLMEPEEVSKETLIRQGKPSEVTCLPCSITEQISAQRAFDRVEPVKPHQGHAFQPQAPLQPQCAQQ